MGVMLLLLLLLLVLCALCLFWAEAADEPGVSTLPLRLAPVADPAVAATRLRPRRKLPMGAEKPEVACGVGAVVVTVTAGGAFHVVGASEDKDICSVVMYTFG